MVRRLRLRLLLGAHLKVGSQVMLVIPAAEAYGDDAEAHELGGETLIFVVDVLDAAHTAD